MSRRGEPTDRDAFVAVWIEQTRERPAHDPNFANGQRFSGRHEALCDAVELMRRARAADRYAVNLCNREVSDRETRASDKNRAAMLAIVEKYGFRLITGGDPRGYVVKVVFRKDGPSNTWGGAEEGWGVPS